MNASSIVRAFAVLMVAYLVLLVAYVIGVEVLIEFLSWRGRRIGPPHVFYVSIFLLTLAVWRER